MFDAFQIATSGLQAAMRRVEVAASNIANADTVGSFLGTGNTTQGSQPYEPLIVDQSSLPGGGVAATVRNSPVVTVAQYDPQSPNANAQGMVAAPNVDPLKEFANLMSARLDLMANVAVIKTSSDMVKKLYQAVADDQEDDRRVNRSAKSRF